MTSGSRPPGPEFKKDVAIDKPGIVGARWWHQGLLDEEARMSRRQAMVGIATATGVVAAVAGLAGLAFLDGPEETTVAHRESLVMQRVYGWDFGARGTPLVFDGKSTTPFVRADLAKLPVLMTPNPGPFAKYHVPTLLESLSAAPAARLPDPGDGGPPADGVPFKKLVDVIEPIYTPAMQEAYAAGEELVRLLQGRTDLAVVVDMPGPQSVAFAAGAASAFEPVLLFDNWPHPKAVVPSHVALAALAYYQPRFAETKTRKTAMPLFVLDRSRLSPYSENSALFDNRYYAKMPKLSSLSKDGIKSLLYVVASPASLPEPDDLNPIFAQPKPETGIDLRAVALADLKADQSTFWGTGTPEPGAVPLSAARGHQFLLRALAPPPSFSKVPVIVSASGLIISAALDRSGSMNRFSGGWYG